MQKKETAIEVKVGALVLFATALLVAFVFLLGDVRFGDQFEVHVQFDTAAGLKPGADVAISGIDVGNVRSVEFEKNDDPEMGLPAVAVEVTLNVDEQYADAIREDSQFYITTRGVLGEPYVEIATASFDAPAVQSGDVLRGSDPPRMEIILEQATEVLETVLDMLRDDHEEVGNLVVHASEFFEVVGGAVADNRETVDSALHGLDTTTSEAGQFLTMLNSSMGEDGQRLQAIVGDVESASRSARNISGQLDGDLAPIMDDVSETAASARNISDSAERIIVDNEGRILASIENVETTTENLEHVSDDAVDLMQGVQDGEGTIGALMVDREVYEDLRDITRTIKQQPWRILWKE